MLRVYKVGPLLMHDVAKTIPKNVNLRAKMLWRKLKINLWRFVRPRNRNLIKFVASLTNIRTVIQQHLPMEILLQILSNLTTNELMALVKTCAISSQLRYVKISSLTRMLETI